MLRAYNDHTGRRLFQYRLYYEFPDFVKNASVHEINDTDDLPDSAFALVKDRRYPCHTKAATWLSYLYFINEEHHNRDALDRLQKYASFFGIEEEIKKIKQRYKELREKRSAENLSKESYLLPSKSKYPVLGKESLLKAAQWFSENVVSFTFEDRREFANNLLDKAYSQNVYLPEDHESVLQKCAGLAIYNPREAVAAILSRKKMAEEVLRHRSCCDEIVKRYRDFKEKVENNPEWGFSLYKSASLSRELSQIDDAAGLSHVLEKKEQLPEFIFGTVPMCKIANYVKNTVRLKTGSVYLLDDFKRVPMSVWKKLLNGEKLAELTVGGLGMNIDLEKTANWLRGLTSHEATFIEDYLKVHNVYPMLKSSTTPE